ncbi:unnamed protein product [Thelazia callipaeda]|uniref:CA domain-containing protein n=1 Tax=Thelazia callipaeda TaxID=103827 RepID=A0A0N5CP86_THECL|nr:unnamed protein product [Thelazia callipaeda]
MTDARFQMEHQDVNDNPPIFYPKYYNVSVRQNTGIGSPLILLSANDADSGLFGKVSYRLVTNRSNTFWLDSKSGRLYVQELLLRKNYELRIEAVDGGGLVSEDQAVVHISVISATTPSPVFTSTLYKFDVTEEILPGIEIGQVKAHGPLPISYSIYSGDPDHFFTIDSNTGQISVDRYLDADKWDEVLLNVQPMQAWMEGDGINHTQVLIKIIDTNDNDPTFEIDKIESYIEEDHPIHQAFFVVQAYDKDRGKNGQVLYSLIQSDPPCPIAVHSMSGELSLLSLLDFEVINKYMLVIQARDQGIPARYANITVILNVLDVNDNKPEFAQEMYFVEVAEDVPLMTDLLTVQAKDLDINENGRVSYSFQKNISQFGIHPIFGNIFVKSTLDRETVAKYNLTVIATDHGKLMYQSKGIYYQREKLINCPFYHANLNKFTMLTENV